MNILKELYYNSVFDRVAKAEGITRQELIASIQESIDDAMADVANNPTPEALAFWSYVSCKGQRPTPAEFLEQFIPYYKTQK